MLRSNRLVTIIVVLVFNVFSSVKVSPLPEDIHAGFLLVNDNIYKEKFDEAENAAKKMMRQHPNHPAGYLCMAIVIESWMAYYQTDKKEDVFYRFCDLAIEKGEKLCITKKDVPWVKFFMGGADGYKGTYEARYERWITAFRYGWKGVSVLLDLQSEGYDIPDANYGIGSYNYWRSALMKVLWWMPGIEDKREEGIRQLKMVQEQGVYSKVRAAAALVDILINEERYSDALATAEKTLVEYPEAAIFLWGKAQALYGLKKYPKAIPILYTLINKAENESYDNHYNTTLYHFYLAQIFYTQQKYVQVIAECNMVEKYLFEPKIKKRLTKILGDMRTLRRRSMNAMAKRR